MVASTPRPSSGLASRRDKALRLEPTDLSGHPAGQRHQAFGEIPHARRAGRRLVQHVEQSDIVKRQLVGSTSARFSVAYIRSAESRKFCHDRCSAKSRPGISLAVRPAMIPPSRHGKHRVPGGFAGSSVIDMHAIVAESPDRLTWQEVPESQPRRGEVVHRGSAAASTAPTCYRPPATTRPRLAPARSSGSRCPGPIAEVGEDVDGWSIGQEVCALLAGGGYAESSPCPQGRSCRCRRRRLPRPRRYPRSRARSGRTW